MTTPVQQTPGTTPVVIQPDPNAQVTPPVQLDSNAQNTTTQTPAVDTPNPALLDLQNKLALADKARVAAQTQLDALERKDKTDLENAQADIVKVTAENEALKAEVQNSKLENAFLIAGKHDWQNPGAALRLIDRTMIMFAEDGTVTGVDKAADALAKSDPYLLKTADAGNAQGGTTRQTPAPPSGSQPGQGAGNNTTPDRDRLLRKYPVLRR